MSHTTKLAVSAALALFMIVVPNVAGAQTIDVDEILCLPIGENAVAWATINEVPSTAIVRLNFRRLNSEAADFYWVEMRATGEDRHWGVFPKPEGHGVDDEDLEEQRNQATTKQLRAGESLVLMDDDGFEDWLDQLENEPVEFYVSLHDPLGAELATSPVHWSVVLPARDCEIELTQHQRGEAQNMTIGEYASWQTGDRPFHWMCDGLVTRIDPEGVKHGDVSCRSCVPCPSAVGDIIYGYETRTLSPSEF